jgi:hypothetical protein
MRCGFQSCRVWLSQKKVEATSKRFSASSSARFQEAVFHSYLVLDSKPDLGRYTKHQWITSKILSKDPSNICKGLGQLLVSHSVMEQEKVPSEQPYRLIINWDRVCDGVAVNVIKEPMPVVVIRQILVGCSLCSVW